MPTAPTAPGRGSDQPPVEVSALVVRYGRRTAVDGLSFTVGRGEVLALLGPNGAGKTTTVETLEGYRRPDDGSVRVLGLDPMADRRALAPRIGVMLQRGGIYPMLGPRRALELFAAFYEDPEDVDRMLDLVSLTVVARTPWRHLSGGEQQRLALALALVGRPDVVFLDEPTAGVDPEGRLGIREVVADLRDRGVCVLLTTHELAEAERMADRVVIVHEGRALAAGTPAELAAGDDVHGEGRGGGARTGPVITFGAPPGLAVAALGEAIGAVVVEEAAGRYRVAAPASPALTARLAGWLAEHDAPLTDLRTGRTLEEAYLEVLAAIPAGTSRTPTEVGDAASGVGRRRRGRRGGRRAAR
jgi:ABC-2 type transport system ATP-binding protein